MAVTPDRTFTQGSTSIPLVLDLVEKNGKPVDLTGATQVKFNVRPADRCRGVSTSNAEIVDAAHGQVRHFFSDAEVALPLVLLVNVSWIDAAGRARWLPDNRYITVQLIPNLLR